MLQDSQNRGVAARGEVGILVEFVYECGLYYFGLLGGGSSSHGVRRTIRRGWLVILLVVVMVVSGAISI